MILYEIMKSISDRNVVEVCYRNGGWRTIEPHCLGQNGKGNDVLSAFQIDGYSEEGKLPDWRTFLLRDVVRIRVTDRHFAFNRPKYNPNDTRMRRIYARV